MVDGPGVYAYVSNSPIRLHDPNGKEGRVPPLTRREISSIVDNVVQAAPYEFQYAARPSFEPKDAKDKTPPKFAYASIIKRIGEIDVRHTVTINFDPKTRNSGVKSNGTAHDVTVGISEWGKLLPEERRRLAAVKLFHELIHVDLAIGDPQSKFVKGFNEYRERARPIMDSLRSEVESFVNEVRVGFERSNHRFSDEAIAVLKEILPEFLLQEAYVHGEEQKAFPGALTRSLAEHLRIDLDGKLESFLEKFSSQRNNGVMEKVSYAAARDTNARDPAAKNDSIVNRALDRLSQRASSLFQKAEGGTVWARVRKDAAKMDVERQSRPTIWQTARGVR
jgi:hypothetical protein